MIIFDNYHIFLNQKHTMKNDIDTAVQREYKTFLHPHQQRHYLEPITYRKKSIIITNEQEHIFIEYMKNHMYIPSVNFKNTAKNCEYLNIRTTDFINEFVSYCKVKGHIIKINREIVTRLIMMFNEHPIMKNKYHEIKRWIMKDNKRYYSPLAIRSKLLFKEYIPYKPIIVNLKVVYIQEEYLLSNNKIFCNEILTQIVKNPKNLSSMNFDLECPIFFEFVGLFLHGLLFC